MSALVQELISAVFIISVMAVASGALWVSAVADLMV